jgi:hypothetical protein
MTRETNKRNGKGKRTAADALPSQPLPLIPRCHGFFFCSSRILSTADPNTLILCIPFPAIVFFLFSNLSTDVRGQW